MYGAGWTSRGKVTNVIEIFVFGAYVSTMAFPVVMIPIALKLIARWLSAGYPSPTLVHPTFPWGDYQSLFRDKDSVELFWLFLTALQSDRNDLALRCSAISLYWHLSRLYPAYREEKYDTCGEPTGTYYPDYDISDEWLASQRQYQGNLAQIVKIVESDDCTDWPRTKWEITNACAATDWHLARRLLNHARKNRFISETTATAIRANLEHRILFGNDIDGKLGLGRNRILRPEWREFRERFRTCPECALEALEVSIFGPPFARAYSDFECDDVTDVSLIWCALDQNLPYPSETQLGQIEAVIKDVERLLPSMGDYSALYLSYVAQFQKVLGRFERAAEAYRRLMDMPNLLGWKPIPFALEAASLFRKCNRLVEAELILRKIVGVFPDAAECWEELVEVLMAGEKTQEAGEAAKIAESLAGVGSLKPATILLSRSNPALVTKKDIEQKFAGWVHLGLSSSTLTELHQALGNEINAERDAQKVMKYTETAAFYYGKAVECELLGRVFLRWRNGMTVTDRKRLSTEVREYDLKLCKFLGDQGNEYKLCLGDMAKVIGNAGGRVGAFASIFSFLRLNHPGLLDSSALQSLSMLRVIRNNEGHPHPFHHSLSQGASDANKAGQLARQIFQALNSGA